MQGLVGLLREGARCKADGDEEPTPAVGKLSTPYFYKATNVWGLKLDGKEILQAWFLLPTYVFSVHGSANFSFKT